MTNYLDIDAHHTWHDLKEDGTKNTRARKKRKLSDDEYLDKVSKLKTDNYYAQRENLAIE